MEPLLSPTERALVTALVSAIVRELREPPAAGTQPDRSRKDAA